jgi:drug/metabolite transporter (DMT)-like permease
MPAGSGAATGAKKNSGMAKGYLFLVLFAFFVAWQTPFVTILQNHGVPAVGTVTMTFVVAAVLINLIDLVTGRIKTVYREGRQHLKALLLMGVLNFMGSIGLFSSVRTLDAGVAVALLYLSPVVICLFYFVTRLRPVSRHQWIAVAVCVTGCALAVNVFQVAKGGLSVQGVLFGILAATCMGGYVMCNDLLVPKDMDKWTAITFVLDVAACLSIVVYPGMFEQFTGLSLLDIGIFIYVAGVTKIVCLHLMLAGTKIVGAARSAVVQSMEIPFTLLLAFVTLHQMLGPVELLGTGLVVLSVILMQRQ